MERRCPKCPGVGSQEPCIGALESIHNMQAAALSGEKDANLRVETPCQWAINSAEHNYCFWNLSKEMDGEPIPDKDICNYLCITQEQLKNTFESAIRKLKLLKNTDSFQELRELLLEHVNGQSDDYTVYFQADLKDGDIHNKVNDAAKEASGLQVDESSKPKIVPMGMGQPMHISGKRVDLYNLSKDKIKNKRTAYVEKKYKNKKNN